MDHALFEKIINTAQDCVFWKDENRRFLGVNRSFLEYYGFESADVLIGKTDEDMGWHKDEEPFKQDELRVLQGESTYKVHGKCMVAGKERDIIASKSPIIKNGKVVGLVGSFLDVTDVINKKTLAEYAQILYDVPRLRKIPFFDRILDDSGLEDLLDPTTGLLCRAYALEFARHLIEKKTPFTFSIIDLDNFKFINDTYGHRSGDRILMDVAGSLAEYTGEKGIVGRFGGDELLLLNLVDLTYEDKNVFFENMYSGENRVFRKEYILEESEPVITATIGAATFPDDAGDYDKLFSIMDKTLYHGKRRGRNCYTIYKESEHKDLEIRKIAKRSIYANMHEIVKLFASEEGLIGRLKAVMPVIGEGYSLMRLFYADKDGNVTDVLSGNDKDNIGNIEGILDDDRFLCESVNDIKEGYPGLYKMLVKYEAESALIVRIGSGKETLGYLISTEKRKHRIWQEDESGILYFLANLVAGIGKE
ncbi:MAG: GGDEF domain-containing protein [Lachnospiraceae bacterium]|nr:GGDEF domain-containing protein [Lachnospiraceae bacterium]